MAGVFDCLRAFTIQYGIMEANDKKEKSKIALMEEEVLAWWEKHKVFEKTLKSRRASKKRFVFYEGPPTANGMPHPGHVMGRCFKDLFLRYKTMQGYWAPRRAGWDTHGLPVEIEVEKQLGFRAKSDIEKLGVAEFNRLCKESVWKYKDEWERVTKRIGFWLDMEHPYITYENEYMETLWWVIARIFEKGLLVEDYKVTPYCTRCGTGLSSHEIAQGYKTVKEKSVYVKFRIKRTELKDDAFKEKALHKAVFDDHRATDAKEYFVVWTTTPWTLSGNVALAVHSDLEYVRAKKGDEVLVIAKARMQMLGEGWTVLQTLKGKEFAGLEYEQLFSYMKPDKKAFFVVEENFVSADDGSGIVHLAPAYGEDDMAAAKRHGLPVLYPVKENGEFSAELPWQGMFVKRADPLITEALQKRGLLLNEELYEHEYPFCWRCDTPLLYFARKSWFVKMSLLKKELLSRNATINWIPSHIKEGRFGKWLKDVKDWAFSRERYWGT
ncbi:class I tRNA ligase family protein, partial [Candidatus Azambacteria bacterium]|nr:class I tRNA ligase family protein [Candidatus Azambacteria bacterium]